MLNKRKVEPSPTTNSSYIFWTYTLVALHLIFFIVTLLYIALNLHQSSIKVDLGRLALGSIKSVSGEWYSVYSFAVMSFAYIVFIFFSAKRLHKVKPQLVNSFLSIGLIYHLISISVLFKIVSGINKFVG
jgi:hypothetical protein